MNCCFMCSSFKSMNSARSEVSPSMAEYLEKEKLCQEICKTITQSVESTDIPIATINVPNITLLPELNTDDIEGILHQISELLTPQSGENSQAQDLEGLDDSRSVEEILKEAENLVRASTPYFEKRSGNNTGWAPLPRISSPRSLSKGESREVPDKKGIGGDPEEPVETKEESVEERPPEKKVEEASPQESSEPPEETRKLSLADLATPEPNATFILSKPTIDIMPKVTTNHLTDNLLSSSDLTDGEGRHKVCEEKALVLQKQIATLNSKLADYEKDVVDLASGKRIAHTDRIKLLEEEVKCKDQLIAGYQRENQRLSSDLTAAKGIWKETEIKLVEQIKQLELQLKGTVELNGNEARNLREKLKDAQDSNVQLELQINAIINENKQLLSSNEELTIDVTRLRCEVEEYKKEIEDWGKKERDRIASVESSAVLQGKLSQLNTEVTKKQTEIVRLNGEVGRLRGELERIRLGSVVNHPSETFNITVNQLQSALALERDNTKEVLKEKDQVNKENLDLKRQVKELESIIKRRTKSGNLPICFEAPLSPQDLKMKESLEQKNRDLEHQLSRLQSQFASSQETIRELKLKYERDIHELEQQLKKVENENTSLKHSLEDNPPKSARKLNSTASSINAASVKEDAHLLATIRGLKMELSGRDKEVMRLNKELEDTRKTNRRLQKEREKALNSAVKTRGAKDIDKHSLPRSLESSAVGKNYNPVLFEEDQETLMFLRAENKTLRDEIKRLEQDLISLHNKRIQDLSDLQQEHDVEMSRFLREHSAKHSTATVSHLQGQIYTQTMVINHLKQQIKELEKRAEEIPMLKAERDQLESTLIEANKKIARLHDLASPESVQYSGLLEKLEMVERRHEVREQKLQAIVRDLIARQSEAGLCGPTCRDKLMNKNREICYYRAEMDRILDTLAEFRWSK